MSFKFLDYEFNGGLATFRYESEGVVFAEKVHFLTEGADYEAEATALDRALFLAFVVIGTSYYKARAGRSVELNRAIDARQAEIFSKIYQEGMSQFAYENNLTRADLAHFVGEGERKTAVRARVKNASLVMVSGGKDSLLAAELIKESGAEYRVAYITAQESYPEIIDELGELIIIRREIDKEALGKIGGMNGHVPVTIINEAIALVQAVLLGFNRVEFGIGKEGVEPHAWIFDLPVNHQWAKTEEAQTLIREYVRDYVTSDVEIGSLLDGESELEIARRFAEKCWAKYGTRFSSCNVANYKQSADNRNLKWCGKCAKCANSYLLFAPFVPYEEQKKIFGRDLFEDAEMTEIFKGLLGVDGVMKPFECVASTDELRWAYENRLPGYGELPFLK